LPLYPHRRAYPFIWDLGPIGSAAEALEHRARISGGRQRALAAGFLCFEFDRSSRIHEEDNMSRNASRRYGVDWNDRDLDRYESGRFAYEFPCEYQGPRLFLLLSF
jgi:hypothetical protein